MFNSLIISNILKVVVKINHVHCQCSVSYTHLVKTILFDILLRLFRVFELNVTHKHLCLLLFIASTATNNTTYYRNYNITATNIETENLINKTEKSKHDIIRIHSMAAVPKY